MGFKLAVRGSLGTAVTLVLLVVLLLFVFVLVANPSLVVGG